MVSNFHKTKADSGSPLLGVEPTQTGAIQLSVDFSVSFEDVEPIVVLTLHEVGMVDLMQNLHASDSQNIQKERNILVDERE